jgi:hypothetical protein
MWRKPRLDREVQMRSIPSLKRIAATVAVAGGLLTAGTLAATPALADHRDHWRGHHHRHHHHHHGPRASFYYGPQVYYAPPPVYYAPRPYYYAPYYAPAPAVSFGFNFR